jgi:hypothetical protein
MVIAFRANMKSFFNVFAEKTGFARRTANPKALGNTTLGAS